MQELFPRKIAPGWLQRWIRQSWELWRRAPLLLTTVSLGGLYLNALLPGQNTWPATLVIVIANAAAAGLLFNALRSADRSGTTPGSEFLRQLQATRQDLWKLSVNIGLYCTFIGSILAVAFHGFQEILEPPVPALPSGNSMIFSILGLISMAFFWPGIAQMLFLTLKIGNSPSVWLRFGFHSCLQNPSVLWGWQISGLGILAMLALDLPNSVSFTHGLLGVGILSLLWYWAGSWAYLYCREMYEGETENQAQVEKTTVPENAIPLKPASPI